MVRPQAPSTPEFPWHGATHIASFSPFADVTRNHWRIWRYERRPQARELLAPVNSRIGHGKATPWASRRSKQRGMWTVSIWMDACAPGRARPQEGDDGNERETDGGGGGVFRRSRAGARLTGRTVCLRAAHQPAERRRRGAKAEGVLRRRACRPRARAIPTSASMRRSRYSGDDRGTARRRSAAMPRASALRRRPARARAGPIRPRRETGQPASSGSWRCRDRASTRVGSWRTCCYRMGVTWPTR